MILQGYDIGEQIYNSGKTAVYRACRQSDGLPVVVKVPAGEYPTIRDTARWRHAYEIANTIKSDGIVRHLALEKYNNGVALILEDFGGVSLDRILAEGKMEIGTFLRVAITLSETVAAIHDAAVIHKDLKPANIVVAPGSGVVKITDFGISSLLSQHHQSAVTPNQLEGSLAYISPEQTGRMNRVVDYRSDLYSLGVCFYEMLIGQPPFTASDPMELIHCHLARVPASPTSLDPAIPTVISNIVLKLLAKTAEQRYQSAEGLLADLEECELQWKATRAVQTFLPGRRDHTDRFQIPQHLYGREREIAALLGAFERVSAGGTEVVLVKGAPGVGKSALVNEIHKPVVRQRAFFISGKYDLSRRNIPHAALIEAFQQLVQHLLTMDEAQLSEWRERLLEAVGGSGRIIADVIPIVELIIGPQPPVPALGPSETQNRFMTVFQRFMNVFASRSHPLVIFLDDLQWADADSLKLLSSIITDSATNHLMVIGAYRDAEVGEFHSLTLAIDSLVKDGASIATISVGPLDHAAVKRLIADTLRTDDETTEPLAGLVHRKTGGNAFFVSEFLNELHRTGRVEYNRAHGRWVWDLTAIERAGLSENVVDLITGKIHLLSPGAQDVLRIAASIGNKIDLSLVSEVFGAPLPQVATYLWEALQQFLIVPLDGEFQLVASVHSEAERLGIALPAGMTARYKFSHDRVQAAAYDLIPEAERAARHLRIGRTMLARTPHDQVDDSLFEIVNQLNAGAACVAAGEERIELVRMNHRAALKAKSATAFDLAIRYLEAATEQLPEDRWTSFYELSYDVGLLLGECRFLATGEVDVEHTIFDEVIAHARTDIDRARVFAMKAALHTRMRNFKDAFVAGLEALRLVGVNLPDRPGKGTLAIAMASLKLQLRGKDIASLVNLPAMTNEKVMLELEILMALIPSAYLESAELLTYMILRMVSLTLKHGIAPPSAYAFSVFGLINGSGLGDYGKGYQFGMLGLDVARKLGNMTVLGKCYHVVASSVAAWHAPVRDVFHYYTEGRRLTLDNGDLIYFNYILYFWTTDALSTGVHLERVYDDVVSHMNYRHRSKSVGIGLGSLRQFILALQGSTNGPTDLSDRTFNEADFVRDITTDINASGGSRNEVVLYYVLKTQLNVYFRDYSAAIVSAREAIKVAHAAIGTLTQPDLYFYSALAAIGYAEYASPVEKKECEKIIKVALRKFAKWTECAPMNFAHKYLLLQAETLRRAGKDDQAADLYGTAIAKAREADFPQDEAFASELAGRFHKKRNQQRIAQTYFTDSRHAWLRWGATRKATDIDEELPSVASPAATATYQTTYQTTDQHLITTMQGSAVILDLTSVMKGAEALAGEIVLPNLLKTLMRISLENAGAQRGVLILESDGSLLIEAEASDAASVEVGGGRRLEGSKAVPETIINYVVRTANSVVLYDAAQEGAFTEDPYIVERKTMSVLCIPLVNQGRLTGVLYLENDLAPAVFTSDRIALLRMLSSQAAISLHNARLYADLQQTNAAYSRFVPREFLSYLNRGRITDVRLGDQIQKDMTVLFTDIWSFTSISESMTPKENFDFLNSILRVIGPVIRQHGGFIDKYIGDSIMALFPNRIDDALHAAVAMRRALVEMNGTRSAAGREDVAMGIGIHTGPLMLGTIGEEERMEGTVIADAVNLASRIEGMTRQYLAGILVSEQTMNGASSPHDFHWRLIDRVKVKGKTDGVGVVEILDGEQDDVMAQKIAGQNAFARGLDLYSQKMFKDAADQFMIALTHCPSDGAATIYYQRASYNAQHGVPDDWSGVETIVTK